MSALWLRAVPLWAWVLLVALCVTGVQQWRVSHYRTQVASITTKHATETQHLAELATMASEAARKAEHTQAVAFDAIAQQYEQDKADAQAKADRTIADLRAGNLRLRREWQGCPASGVPATAAGAGKPDAGADDRAASASRIVRAAADADAQIRGLQAILRAERQ